MRLMAGREIRQNVTDWAPIPAASASSFPRQPTATRCSKEALELNLSVLIKLKANVETPNHGALRVKSIIQSNLEPHPGPLPMAAAAAITLICPAE